ncbi:MAG: C25 family cysteine peptidase, partial [Candidatus Thermoplasmatota archaeon]|nr:C25 family cysteine peptidase [Candidatus Thermoplasmatota archaeon]
FTYNIGAGIQNGEHAIFLSIHAFPARYIPSTNELEYVNEMSIKINYIPPEKPMLNNDVYDLLIVSPSEFSDTLQPLVEHKESYGVRTLLVTLDEIYDGNYFPVQGRDGAEKIKYFIKDSIEEWGIKYVMLFGGKTSYITGNWGYDGPTKVDDSLWHVPVRYAALDDQAEKGYLSDLYFADIYDADGNFSTWDKNGDGIYAAWSFRYGKDPIDGYPDVYVGRLACRSVKEAQTVVNKIITYESTPADPSWFNKMLLIGGDTFNSNDGIYEGEYSTQHLFSFMPSQFQATSLFASDGTLSFGGGESSIAAKLSWMNVIPTFSEGFGFVAFDGHGSPTAWATHFPDKASHDDPWLNGLMTYNMDLLSNGEKLPIVSVGGCHNSEFNISLLDFSKNEWTYQPTYECWSWHLVKMARGGSIATLGYAGLGYGATGDGDKDGIPDCVQYSGGYIEAKFFEAYGQYGKDMLGEAWGQSVTKYIDAFPPMDDRIDCKTIEEWCLLGDPSLKIGGYS